jgi:hypothetical protein
VNVRWLNPAFASFMFFSLFALLLKMILIVPISSLEASTFTLAYLPGFPMTVGRPLAVPMQVRVANTAKIGIPNRTVVARIVAIKAITKVGFGVYELLSNGGSPFDIDLCDSWGKTSLTCSAFRFAIDFGI